MEELMLTLLHLVNIWMFMYSREETKLNFNDYVLKYKVFLKEQTSLLDLKIIFKIKWL